MQKKKKCFETRWSWLTNRRRKQERDWTTRNPNERLYNDNDDIENIDICVSQERTVWLFNRFWKLFCWRNVTKIKAKLINRTQNSNFKLRSKKQKYKIPIMDKLKTNRVLFKQIRCKKRLFITQKRYFIFCNFP